MIHIQKIRYKDKPGTTSSTCPFWKSGICYNELAPKPGHNMCIGTHQCDEFWTWSLKEHNLVEASQLKEVKVQ